MKRKGWNSGFIFLQAVNFKVWYLLVLLSKRKTNFSKHDLQTHVAGKGQTIESEWERFHRVTYSTFASFSLWWFLREIIHAHIFIRPWITQSFNLFEIISLFHNERAEWKCVKCLTSAMRTRQSFLLRHSFFHARNVHPIPLLCCTFFSIMSQRSHDEGNLLEVHAGPTTEYNDRKGVGKWSLAMRGSFSTV